MFETAKICETGFAPFDGEQRDIDIPGELLLKLRRLHRMSLETAGRLHSLREDILENLQDFRDIDIQKEKNQIEREGNINVKV